MGEPAQGSTVLAESGQSIVTKFGAPTMLLFESQENVRSTAASINTLDREVVHQSSSPRTLGSREFPGRC